ncbi:V-type ATP synthase subunit I [Halovenus marina]|uniref:V-type ATP synthase subunit I n=1 Tax=Halovenus marina TaxID=3396621 RepID=UPI003F56BE89
MLRPERMSKISVTGAQSVMSEVIETMHELNLVHITDYDGSWDGFEPGDSLEGADEVSSQLVTVRAIESTLDVDESDVSPAETVDLDDPDSRLEEIRTSVNELDDRRDELRSRLRDIDEQLDQMELFADLGIDLDLLWGYDSLDVIVGEGDPDAIESTLADSDSVEAFDVFSGEGSVAVFAKLDGSLEDELVGVPITTYQVPEESGDPESNVESLERERQQVEAELDTVESELEALKHDSAAFLLALEEQLTIEAQKSEAPLRFATTEHSFIVEGWVPSNRYDELASTLDAEIGDQLEVAELKRASYTNHGGLHEDHDTEDHAEATDGGHADETAVTDGGPATTDDADEQVATDGGRTGDEIVTLDDDPPVIQRNSKITNPFELLVTAVNRPKYSEFDPTIILFLTFPLFFGFMIGDIGYGLLYVLLGYGIWKKVDSEAIANFGAIVAWLGLWTILFGFLYGEVLGLHFLEWYHIEPVFHKGISDTEWAITWLVVAVIVGWVHLNVGYILNFVEEFQLHGAKTAVVEVGSWLLMLNGLWVFIFSKAFSLSKPTFLVRASGQEGMMVLDNGPLGFGFTGFPELVGLIGLGAFVLGIAILIMGPWYEAVEFLVPLAHTLSYTRLTAVLLAKAGMALAVNLLYFGAYTDEEGFHFMHTSTPGHKEEAGKEIIFGGLSNMGSDISVWTLELGLEGALLGIPVYIVGHIVVLAIGGTAAIQAIRLEYFEFFEKFYEGGGKTYESFGHETRYTET